MESTQPESTEDPTRVEPEKILGLDDGSPTTQTERRWRQADTHGATNLLTHLLGNRRPTS